MAAFGAGLACRLEKYYSVKLIERDQQRANKLAEKLQNTIVYGDASDQELIVEEHIDQIDLFIAVTNEDEANIICYARERTINEIRLSLTIVGTAVLGSKVIVADDDLYITQGDHIVMFLTDKKSIGDIEHLQPNYFPL